MTIDLTTKEPFVFTDEEQILIGLIQLRRRELEIENIAGPFAIVVHTDHFRMFGKILDMEVQHATWAERGKAYLIVDATLEKIDAPALRRLNEEGYPRPQTTKRP